MKSGLDSVAGTNPSSAGARSHRIRSTLVAFFWLHNSCWGEKPGSKQDHLLMSAAECPVDLQQLDAQDPLGSPVKATSRSPVTLGRPAPTATSSPTLTLVPPYTRL
jgi:hypothetical protein